MRKIEDLKQGDMIYDISFNRVRWYKYLCVHPTGGGNYHILIDENEEPIRKYHKDLTNMLDKGFETYQQAKLELANRLEIIVKRLREEPESL